MYLPHPGPRNSQPYPLTGPWLGSAGPTMAYSSGGLPIVLYKLPDVVAYHISWPGTELHPNLITVRHITVVQDLELLKPYLICSLVDWWLPSHYYKHYKLFRWTSPTLRPPVGLFPECGGHLVTWYKDRVMGSCATFINWVYPLFRVLDWL